KTDPRASVGLCRLSPESRPPRPSRDTTAMRGSTNDPRRAKSRHSSDFATHRTRHFRSGNVGPPSLKGFPTLSKKRVALVNSCDPRDRAGLVIENLVGDVGRDAEPGHARDAGPAQVVEPPPSNTGELIEDTFGSTEFLERLGSKQREDIRSEERRVGKE